MPLLTVTNLLTSPISLQDPAGSISLTVPGSGSITNKVLTEDQLAALAPQLDLEQTAGNLRWSAKDNPADLADSVPAAPSIIDEAGFYAYRNDFELTAGGTLPAPLAKAVQNSATGDYVANTAGGVYSLATAAVSEAEAAQLTHGDQLTFDPTKTPIFEARVLVNMPGATITA